MEKQAKYPHEVGERAVRLVFGTQDEYPSQTAAMKSIAEKIGCAFDTLPRVRQAERELIDQAIEEGHE